MIFVFLLFAKLPFARPMAGLLCLSRDQERVRRARGLVDSRPVAHPMPSADRTGSRTKERDTAKQLVLLATSVCASLCELGSWAGCVGVLASPRLMCILVSFGSDRKEIITPRKQLALAART